MSRQTESMTKAEAKASIEDMGKFVEFMKAETKELPLKELLRRIRDAAEDSIAVGYVILPLANYMAELQAHSSMKGNLS
jgi:hypothetical protein